MFIPITIQGLSIALGKYLHHSEIERIKRETRGHRVWTYKWNENNYVRRKLTAILLYYKQKSL